MNGRDRELDLRLRGWLLSREPAVVPASLRAAPFSVSGETTWPRTGWLDLRPLRPALVLVALLALLAAGMVAVVVLSSGPIVARNGLIAFASDTASGTSDLFVTEADGSGVRALTTTPQDETHPAWSPGGAQLAFVRSTLECDRVDPIATVGDASVVILEMSSGRERAFPVADGCAVRSMTWTPDAREIVVAWGDGQPRYGGDGVRVAIDVATGTQRTLAGTAAAVSPDGAWLAVQQDGDLVLYGASQTRRLASGPRMELQLAWSPDGAQLAVTAFLWGPNDALTSPRIEVVSLSDGAWQVLAENAVFPTWSPDGHLLAFVRPSSSDAVRSELWVMASDGSGALRIGATMADPKWSPDGTRIYFVGADGVWAVRPDGSDLTRLTSFGSADPDFTMPGGIAAGRGWPTNVGADWQEILP